MTCEPTQTPQDVDIPALREKYRQERDRRVRNEGSKQYIELSGDFAEYYETDPHTSVVPRDPIAEDIDVLVVGGGFGGLLTGAQLKKAGVEDFRIIDLSGDFGGVWYWNRYPGIQCDNESYCYIPMLEELDYVPSKKFIDGVEIYEHCRRIGKHYELYDHAIFSTQVKQTHWDEELKRWRISTNRGDDIRARFLVLATGSHSRAKLPGIAGIQDFQGHSFHTSRWDYDYTGGDAFGDLDKLADKRVAIIGTGASAIQAVPFLGRHAKHLYVFQRTPSTVCERDNRPTDPEWVKTLKPGWQEERRRNFHTMTFEGNASCVPDQVCDFWTELGRNTAARIQHLDNPAELTPDEFMRLQEEEDYKVMERLRRRVDGVVDDTETAETLKPYYRFFCKRPCSNDDYLPTFNRPNVTLVDVSSSKGVERATERGLVAGGVEYEVDCIIFASGFEISTEISRRFSIDVIEGRDGVSLYDYWADGIRSLHGMTARGFPNQFISGFIQGGVSANITANYELQAEHIAYMIAEAQRRGAVTVEPSQEAQDRWIRTMRETAFDNSKFDMECTPGYFNNEGGGGGEGIRSYLGEQYGPGFYAFAELLQEWRDQGTMKGLVLGT